MNVLCFSLKSVNQYVEEGLFNGQKKSDNRTNNDLQKHTTEKTQD